MKINKWAIGIVLILVIISLQSNISTGKGGCYRGPATEGVYKRSDGHYVTEHGTKLEMEELLEKGIISCRSTMGGGVQCFDRVGVPCLSDYIKGQRASKEPTIEKDISGVVVSIEMFGQTHELKWKCKKGMKFTECQKEVDKAYNQKNTFIANLRQQAKDKINEEFQQTDTYSQNALAYYIQLFGFNKIFGAYLKDYQYLVGEIFTEEDLLRIIYYELKDKLITLKSVLENKITSKSGQLIEESLGSNLMYLDYYIQEADLPRITRQWILQNFAFRNTVIYIGDFSQHETIDIIYGLFEENIMAITEKEHELKGLSEDRIEEQKEENKRIELKFVGYGFDGLYETEKAHILKLYNYEQEYFIELDEKRKEKINIDVLFNDKDGDGVKDYFDLCTTELENWNGFQDNDGCIDELPELAKGQLIQLTDDDIDQINPSIYENKIVWKEEDNLVLYDIEQGKTGAFAIDSKNPLTPVIHKDKIVFSDEKNKNHDVYVLDISEVTFRR